MLVALLLVLCLLRPTSADWRLLESYPSYYLSNIDKRPKYTYDEAKNKCSKLKMLESILPMWKKVKILPGEEFWNPEDAYGAAPAYVTAQGVEYASDFKELSHRKGIVCAKPLQGVLLVYRNGTLAHLDARSHVPLYCFPQFNVEQNVLGRLGLAMCLLLHKKIKRAV